MAFSEALAERIRERLARRKNVEEKKVFGGAGGSAHTPQGRSAVRSRRPVPRRSDRLRADLLGSGFGPRGQAGLAALNPLARWGASMTTILENALKVQRGETPPPPIGRLLGFVLKVIEPGRAVFEMGADERHHNLMGTLHGGVYCDLADAAMGYAYASTLAEGETFTSVELKINFFRPVRKGRLTAEAKVVKAGSTLAYVECDVTDQTGKLVARASSTCMKLRDASR
jgi:uncharacterized protein (TIGR00369 family)